MPPYSSQILISMATFFEMMKNTEQPCNKKTHLIGDQKLKTNQLPIQQKNVMCDVVNVVIADLNSLRSEHSNDLSHVVRGGGDPSMSLGPPHRPPT
jgi:hypothetical protein